MVGPEPPQKCMTTRMAGWADTVVGTYSHIWSPPGLDPKLVTCCSDDVRAAAGDTLMATPARASVTTPTMVTRPALIRNRPTFFSLSIHSRRKFRKRPGIGRILPCLLQAVKRQLACLWERSHPSSQP